MLVFLSTRRWSCHNQIKLVVREPYTLSRLIIHRNEFVCLLYLCSCKDSISRRNLKKGTNSARNCLGGTHHATHVSKEQYINCPESIRSRPVSLSSAERRARKRLCDIHHESQKMRAIWREVCVERNWVKSGCRLSYSPCVVSRNSFMYYWG